MPHSPAHDRIWTGPGGQPAAGPLRQQHVQFTRRTSGSTLFVNPLMAMYFTVDLDKLAARCLYLDRIENTWGRRQVIGRIATFRNEISTRIPHAFPH